MNDPGDPASPPDPSPLHGDRPRAATPQALADRRELAFVAVERTHMPMVMVDTRQDDLPIVMANQAFLNLTGYDADEVIGRNCRFLQGPETCRVTLAELRAAIQDGRDATVELLNYRKDGSTFWNELHISPIQDDDGQVIYIFGSQRDVSERRSAQALAASEHRLMREVDHRAMNVLALVEGIVRLSNAESAAQYAASIQRRVQALAKAHTLLARHWWSSVPLDQVILEQVAPFGASRIALEGPAVRLGATLVQPLALALHELIANAVTHGSLSAAGGVVRLEWRQPDDDHVELAWREIGGPPPLETRPRGLGSTVIVSTLQRQLGGVFHARWPATGLQADITIPLNRAEPREE